MCSVSAPYSFEGTGISLSFLDEQRLGRLCLRSASLCFGERSPVNIAQWIGSSITRRIAAATVLLTMSLVAVLGVVSYQNMRSHIRKTIDATLQNDADQIAFHVERLLHAINENAESIAGNYSIASALRDTAGRSSYLVPFFLSYQLPEQVSFRIALCDLKGEFLAGNAQRSSYASLRDKALVQQVSRKGLPFAAMLPDERHVGLRIAHPVRPSASMGPQGMLVMDILLDDIFSRAWREERAQRSMNVSFRCCDARIWEQTTFSAKNVVTYSRPLHHLHPPLDGLNLAISVSEPADEKFLPLKRLTSIYVLTGLLALLLTLVLARLLAGRISRPLRSLTMAANTVAESGFLAVEIGAHGPDEVGSLGKAFGTMLSRLREATEGLERRVQERTRDLEQAYEDLHAEKTFSDSVIDSLPGIFYAMDAQGKLIRRNRNHERITGYTDEEIARMTALELFPPEERERVAAKIQEALATGYAAIETVALTRQGKRMPFFVTGARTVISGRTLIIGMGIDISDRKIAEEESRTILRTAMDGFLMTDREGFIIEVNDYLCGLLGYPRDALLQMHVRDIEASQSPEEIQRQIERVVEAGSARFESAMRRRDGSLVDLEISINHSPDKGGRLMAFLRDITGRKRAEEALRESEEKFRALTESTSDWIWEIDCNGVYVYSSPKVRDILGYEPDEVLGRTPFDLMIPGEPDRLGPQVASAFAAHEPLLRMENNNLHKDGRIVVLETSGVPIFDRDGRWTGYRGIDRDITERKASELALRKSEERYRLLSEMSPDMIGIQQEGVLIYMNNSGVRLLGGQRPEQFLGRPILSIIHPDYQAVVQERIKRTIELGTANPIIEEKFVRLDGTSVEVEAVSVSFSYKDKPATMVIARDITERKQAERAVEEMNRTLQARVQEEVAKNREKDRLMMVQSRQAAMGEMLGNIAHQWRQPLNIVGLLIQDILDAQVHGQLTPDYLEKGVRKSMDVIQHMSQTIDDFRGFYRTDKKKQAFLLNEVVDRVLAFVETGFRKNHLAVDVKMSTVVAATGYPNEFAQVLLNILNNAKDVLLERKVRSPKLAIRVFSDQGRSVVTIADNAGGIAEGDLDRIFEPFFTTKEEGRGTGIGLYMSKIIIEKHLSGRLTARNIAEGAEFRIEV